MRGACTGLLIGLLHGCSAGDPAGAARVAVTDGTLDTARSAVVALRARRFVCPEGHEVETFCSGVLVSPRAVVTAAHCVTDRDPEGIEVYFGTEVLLPGIHERVIGALVHPDYDAASRANDVAVLVLAQDAVFDPMPLGGGLTAADVGTTITVSGFGAPGPRSEAGVRRAGTATIDAVEARTLRLGPGPSLPCLADSGGAVVRDEGSGEALVGIVRSGDEACATMAVASRADAYESFLRDAIAAAAGMDAPELPDIGSQFCAAACESDDDCAPGMACLLEREGRRCGYPELRPGLFGAECASDAECSERERCAAYGSGAEQRCRCFLPCRSVPPPGDGGCAIGPRGEDGAAVLIAAICLVFVHRSRMRQRRVCKNRTARAKL